MESRVDFVDFTFNSNGVDYREQWYLEDPYPDADIHADLLQVVAAADFGAFDLRYPTQDDYQTSATWAGGAIFIQGTADARPYDLGNGMSECCAPLGGCPSGGTPPNVFRALADASVIKRDFYSGGGPARVDAGFNLPGTYYINRFLTKARVKIAGPFCQRLLSMIGDCFSPISGGFDPLPILQCSVQSCTSMPASAVIFIDPSDKAYGWGVFNELNCRCNPAP